jgi:hypothetical protein
MRTRPRAAVGKAAQRRGDSAVETALPATTVG